MKYHHRLLPFLFVTQLLLSEGWKFAKEFPNSIDTKGYSVHGLAVDPYGNLWVQYYNNVRGDSVREANGTMTPVRAIYVYDRNGNNVSFSPIKILSGAGINDTLFISPTNRAVTNRGMATDAQGNILVSVFDAVYQLDFKTGAVLNKTKPFLPLSTALTAPAADDLGNFVIGTVLPGNPLIIYDKNFQVLTQITDSADGYSRSMAMSKDGKEVYYAGYNKHRVIWWHSDNGVLGPYTIADTILYGFDCESFARHPVTNDIWASAGSGNDMPNRYPGLTTDWASHTWYAWNPETRKIVDTIPWVEVQDPVNLRPRAMAFSWRGDTVYIGCFQAPANLVPIQMYVHQGSFSLDPEISLPDTINIGQLFVGFPDTVSIPLKSVSRGILSVTKISTDNNQCTILGPTAFSISAGATYFLRIAVNTPSIGEMSALITVESDAITPVKTVRLIGTIGYAPVISIPSELLQMTFSNEHGGARTLTIKNSGAGSLKWSICGSPSLFGLNGLSKSEAVPELNVEETDAERLHVADANDIPIGQRKRLEKQSQENAGNNNPVLLWTGGAIASYWNSLVATLKSAGYSVDHSTHRPIDANRAYDAIFICEPEEALTQAEIAELKDYIQSGGRVIEMSDSYFEFVNPLLAEFGITRLFSGYVGSVTSVHDLFRGVGTLTLDANSWDNRLQVASPALSIATCRGEPVAALSSNNGLLVLGDDSPFSDLTASMTDPDNQLLLQNIISWIRTGICSWVTLSATAGVIAPSDSFQLSVTVNPSFLKTGDYNEELYLHHNDPRTGCFMIQVALSVITDTRRDAALPQALELMQNYPNPFNPSTTIRYAIPAAGTNVRSSQRVILKIYDLLGREIETLVDEVQTAGWKEVRWNSAKVAGGVYFYKIHVGSVIETKRMLVVK